uniref:Reverse transcriptase domain-containing protein n=1 Tax=Tanacetum cinerariifolium TaxID=118510 RepID=A0A6L2MGA6_TANCI|nr:reverse transcriptase domain-containing protein [Tanacetum cinerariifolium]
MPSKKKMEAQYGKFFDMTRGVRINVPLVDVLAGMPNYGKFLKEFVRNKHKLEQISSAFLSDESSSMIQNKVPFKLKDPKSFLISYTFSKSFSCNALADLVTSKLMPYSLYAKLSLKTLKPIKMSISIDVIDEILEADFDALLDEGSEILHSIKGPILKEKLFSEFDEFMAMNIEGKSKFESDTEEPPFKKITFNTDYKIKTSLEERPSNLELKPLPNHLEYVFLEEPSFLPKRQPSHALSEHTLIGECLSVYVMLQLLFKEGIVLGYKVSGAGLEVDKAEINVIYKLPPPTNVKGVRSFLGQLEQY